MIFIILIFNNIHHVVERSIFYAPWVVHFCDLLISWTDIRNHYFQPPGRPSSIYFLACLHLFFLNFYTGDISYHNDEVLGASAHSDYGMITLLATDGVPGLQVPRPRHKSIYF